MYESPEDLIPYKALTTRAFFPASSGPNSDPNVVQIFSKQGMVKYVFWMSDVLTSISFNKASMRVIQTHSLKKTLANVNMRGATVA